MHSDPASPATSAVRMGVDVRRFPWIRRLAADYVYAFESVAPFFSGNPALPAAWRDAIERVQAYPRARDAVVAIVEAQQQRRGAPAGARAAARTLADTGAVAVVTGQQAGLFGGPLFTLLKALAAIKVADRIAREHQIPAVPVFWIDAEDHDWDEISACGVLDPDLRPRTIRLAAPDRAGEVPVAALRLNGSIGAALADLRDVLPGSEFTSELLDNLRAAYRPEMGVADAFGRWLETVLGPRGLVVFDASDPAAKPIVGGVFERELAEPGRTPALAGRAGAELVALGYHAQVTPPPDSIALFHLDGGREPIRRRGDELMIGGSTRPAAAVLEEARAHPDRFSPNVLLRPVVQDTLFPTICYVAGPNELAYLAQLGGVYASFGVPMPLIYPRTSATIIDAAAARFFTKYNLPIEQLQPQDEGALNRLLEAQLPASVDRALDEASRAVRDRMEALIAAVPSIDPTLEGAARSTLSRMEHDLRTLHGKIIQASKRRHDVLRRQFMHVRAQVFPDGEPQERFVGFVYFLNQYGPALVDRLIEELPLDLGQHWVLTI